MAGDNLYLLAALPGLGDLGSVPPMTPARFLEQVIDSDGNRALLEALLLSDDLLQRQAYLSGEAEQVGPVVLTPAQSHDEEALPEYLDISFKGNSSHLVPDAVLEAYFRYASSVADAQNSDFLRGWIKYEVGLRNALATERAKALNLDPQESIITEDLGEEKEDFSAVISEWGSAPDPLEGLRILDSARWRWLGEHDGWFSFEDDELAAYGVRLMLLQRWNRLEKGSSSQPEKALVSLEG
ncbi:MAG: DUF2764 family protein [Chloroflexota bacterium]|nr:DUF2764 family protein [Chloroflexota bacterium]